MTTTTFERVHALLRSGRRAAALRALFASSTWRLKEPFSDDPNHAWYCVGTALFDSGKFDLASRAFKKSLRTRPDDFQALWALGDCYSELGHPKLAERYFAKAIRFGRKESALALTFNLANAFYDQGKFREAIRKYRRVLRGRDKAIARRARKNLALAKAKLEQAAR